MQGMIFMILYFFESLVMKMLYHVSGSGHERQVGAVTSSGARGGTSASLIVRLIE